MQLRVVRDTEANLNSTTFNASEISGIDSIEKELYDILSDSKGVIREMCSHILSAGGKRIRPLLVYYSGLIFSCPSKEIIRAAAAAELIHMASLVHDDIIDESSLRRSKPSINKAWGNHFAVLCGDYLFAKAFGVLADSRLTRSLDLMVESIQNMCHGEILQAGDRFKLETSIEKYYDIIGKKTAKFMECCCKSGAAVAGANDIYIQILGEYGSNIGYAFQIIDDILDFCGDATVMGKPKGEDLRQGSITLPVILLQSDDKYRDLINEIIRKKDFTSQVIEHISEVIKESGIIEKSFSIAISYVERAKCYLNLLPESPHTAFLYDLTEALRTRAN